MILLRAFLVVDDRCRYGHGLLLSGALSLLRSWLVGAAIVSCISLASFYFVLLLFQLWEQLPCAWSASSHLWQPWDRILFDTIASLSGGVAIVWQSSLITVRTSSGIDLGLQTRISHMHSGGFAVVHGLPNRSPVDLIRGARGNHVSTYHGMIQGQIVMSQDMAM